MITTIIMNLVRTWLSLMAPQHPKNETEKMIAPKAVSRTGGLRSRWLKMVILMVIVTSLSKDDCAQ